MLKTIFQTSTSHDSKVHPTSINKTSPDMDEFKTRPYLGCYFLTSLERDYLVEISVYANQVKTGQKRTRKTWAQLVRIQLVLHSYKSRPNYLVVFSLEYNQPKTRYKFPSFSLTKYLVQIMAQTGNHTYNILFSIIFIFSFKQSRKTWHTYNIIIISSL